MNRKILPKAVAAAACVLLLMGRGLADEPAGVLVRGEAEVWSGQGGGSVRVLDRAQASGGKTVSYWEKPGVWLELTLDAPREAEYLLSLGYALAWPDTRRKITVDGREWGDVTLETTGSWDRFTAATTTLPPLRLAAGKHLLRFLNADSRGLSLDWTALHSRDVFVADRRLSDEEHSRLMGELGPGADAPDQGALELGRVRVSFRRGAPALVRLGECTLAAGGDGARAAATVRFAETARHRLALVREGGAARGTRLWITDGKSLFLAAFSGAEQDPALPGPVACRDRIRIVTARTEKGETLNFCAQGWQEQRTGRLVAGALQATASPGLRVGPWQAPGPGVPLVRLATRKWAGGWIGAARFSTRWDKDEPRVSLIVEDERAVVRESANRYPTLAAFYGEGMFDLTADKDGRLKFQDVGSGQTLTFE